MAEWGLRHGGELRHIARELRAMKQPEVTKRFRRELRATAQPLVPAVRASIRGLPSSRPYSTDGLRGRLSRAVRIEVRTTGRQAGVTIRVDGRKMPNKQKRLPALMEGEGVRRGRRVDTRWRHPVFGNPDVWVQQQPHPYFFRLMRVLGPRSRVAVARVLNQITREIT